jgi:hypothetical protein
MRIGRDIALRLFASLIGMAALLTVGVTAFVYSGPEHREAVTSIAREFFQLVEKASRAKSPLVKASPSPTHEGGTIQ